MRKYNFTVLIEEDKESGGYTAVVPALKSGYTEADTMEELVENIKEAIELCLGEDLPEGIFSKHLVSAQQVEMVI
jgi:predicted RNase H-like HicB family nuclease